MDKLKKHGLFRKQTKNGFIYYDKNNNEIDITERKLYIPPNWTDVRVAKSVNSKVQAIGTDSMGRIQYIYNENHIKKAEKNKYNRLYEFTLKMPKLLRYMNTHKKEYKYSKNRVIVTMLTLINKLYLRVGNDKYSKLHNSYGISTLRKKHIKLENDVIYLKFKGKSGKILEYEYKNKNIYEHLKELLELKGYNIFKYVLDGNIKNITSSDLNSYINQYMGDFTCKDFRTYAANHHFIKSLMKLTKKEIPKKSKIKKYINLSIKETSNYLRHTPSVSKSSYVANYIIGVYEKNPKFFAQNDCANTVLKKILEKKYS